LPAASELKDVGIDVAEEVAGDGELKDVGMVMEEIVMVDVENMYEPGVEEFMANTLAVVLKVLAEEDRALDDLAGTLDDPTAALEASREEELVNALEAVADEGPAAVLLEPARALDDKGIEDALIVMLEDGPPGRFDEDGGTDMVVETVIGGLEEGDTEDGAVDALVAGPLEEATGEDDGTELCDAPETELAGSAPESDAA